APWLKTRPQLFRARNGFDCSSHFECWRIEGGCGMRTLFWRGVKPVAGIHYYCRDVFLGPHTVIYGQGGVEIGDHSLISMHCCIVSSNHALAGRDEIIRHKPDVLRPTKIGRDACLGAGVKVLGGVTIGDG